MALPRSICLLLLSVASATVGAREVRRQSAAGGREGQCPETIVQSRQVGAAIRAAGTSKRTPASARADNPEPPVRQQAPRWHSYLPGMFR